MAQKSLNWDESQHPRDDIGEFAAKDVENGKTRRDHQPSQPVQPPAPPPRQTLMFDTSKNKTARLFEGAMFEPSTKKKAAAPAAPKQLSLVEKIEDELKKMVEESKPLWGQKEMFARRFNAEVMRYAKPASGQRTLAWDPDEHPRDDDGEFTFKDTVAKPSSEDKKADTGPAKLTKHEAIKKAMEGSKSQRMNYDQACKATYIYTGTTPSDWKAVPIKGVAEVDTGNGKMRSMPEFDFPSGYSETDTPHTTPGGDMCCQLCGHQIKNAYHIQNDKNKTTMTVGSECVTNFTEGKSGEKLTKEAKYQACRDYVGEAEATINRIKQWHAAVNHNYGGSALISALYKIKNKDVRIAATALARSIGYSNDLSYKKSDYLHTTQEAADQAKKQNRFAEVATDARVSNWVKKYGEKARGWIETIDEFLQAGPHVDKYARRFEAAVMRYAKPASTMKPPPSGKPVSTMKGKGSGHWVTLNGAHVYIDGGKVTKGPAKLTGKNPTSSPKASPSQAQATPPAAAPAKPAEPKPDPWTTVSPETQAAKDAAAKKSVRFKEWAEEKPDLSWKDIPIPDDIHFHEWVDDEAKQPEAPPPEKGQTRRGAILEAATQAAAANELPVEDVLKLMPDAHKFLKGQTKDRELAKAALRKVSGLNAGQLRRMEDKYLDHSSVEGWDTTSREFAMNHPDLGFDPEEHDTPYKVWEFLKEGKAPYLAAHDPRVADLAAEWARPRMRANERLPGDEDYEPQHIEERSGEAVPFARRRQHAVRMTRRGRMIAEKFSRLFFTLAK